MRVLAWGRGRGSTTELIKLAAAEGLYIVCVDNKVASRVVREAAELGLYISLPLTWEEFIAGNYFGQEIKGFVIDDLDRCVQQMTEVPVVAVSLTSTEVSEHGGDLPLGDWSANLAGLDRVREAVRKARDSHEH